MPLLDTDPVQRVGRRERKLLPQAVFLQGLVSGEDDVGHQRTFRHGERDDDALVSLRASSQHAQELPGLQQALFVGADGSLVVVVADAAVNVHPDCGGGHLLVAFNAHLDDRGRWLVGLGTYRTGPCQQRHARQCP